HTVTPVEVVLAPPGTCLKETRTPKRLVATAAWTSSRPPSYDFLRGPWRTFCGLFHYAEGTASPHRPESSWDRRPRACPSPSHNSRRIGEHIFQVRCRKPSCRRPTGSKKPRRCNCCDTAGSPFTAFPWVK